MSLKNVFITGANSGLGLEFVKQLLKLHPKNIFATYRNPARSTELQALAQVNPCIHSIQLDVRNDCKYAKIVEEVEGIVKEDGLNLLINNAGVFTDKQNFSDVDKRTFMEFLEINTVLPVLLTQSLLPLLQKGSCSNPTAPMGLGRAVVVNITSSYGSISTNNDGDYYLSRCCRAALNAATKNLSVDLKDRKILVLALSPGWVRTEQGGPNAPLSVEESVGGMVNVLQNLNDEKTGTFVDYAGQTIPW